MSNFIRINLLWKHRWNSEYLTCKMSFCEIWHSFSPAPCYYRWLITSLALEKCKKECKNLQIILVQGFCPLKIKITLFPGGFRLNPLSPSIHIQILQTDLHSFPLRISWENLTKHQGIFSFVIIFYILTTLSLDNVWTLLGENCCWSLLGLKGLIACYF